MERKIQPPTTIEDGLHKGVITEVIEIKEPYEYLTMVLEFEEGKKIKAGYADFVSPESQLGKLLTRFGADISKIGEIIDPEKLLKNMTCEFQTVKDGKYSKVILESLKPSQ